MACMSGVAMPVKPLSKFKVAYAAVPAVHPASLSPPSSVQHTAPNFAPLTRARPQALSHRR